jgi:hypothetical protein
MPMDPDDLADEYGEFDEEGRELESYEPLPAGEFDQKLIDEMCYEPISLRETFTCDGVGCNHPEPHMYVVLAGDSGQLLSKLCLN